MIYGAKGIFLFGLSMVPDLTDGTAFGVSVLFYQEKRTIHIKHNRLEAV